MLASSGTKSLRGSKRYCGPAPEIAGVRFVDVAWSRRFSGNSSTVVLRAIPGRDAGAWAIGVRLGTKPIRDGQSGCAAMPQSCSHDLAWVGYFCGTMLSCLEPAAVSLPASCMTFAANDVVAESQHHPRRKIMNKRKPPQAKMPVTDRQLNQ